MNLYTRDFQINLVVHLARDDDFFAKTHSYLRLTDFDLPACQLVMETLQDYFSKCGSVPDFRTLQTHILYMMQHPETVTDLIPEEMESLAYVLENISVAHLNTQYYQMQLPEYLKFVRTTQALDSHMTQIRQGQQVDDFIHQVINVNQEIGTQSDLVVESFTADPEPIMKATQFRRIPTSLASLNKFTGRGLGVGEIGMVTACPGVGKTTSLINFMVGAMYAGHRGLFLTLELRGHRIKHRYHSIAGHIDAGLLKIPVPQWPVEAMEQYNYILNPESPFFDKVQIMDMSKRRFTIEDINRGIGMWKEGIDKQYGDADKCTGVYVDWLDRIDPSGLRISRNSRDDTILVEIAEALGEQARKHDVALWTATQGTRAADGVERLKMQHTAYGYHKNDPLDVSLGLGVRITPELAAAQIAEMTATDDDDAVAPPCNRELVFSIMKNRDNPPGVIQFYQGNTLKYWNCKEAANDSAKDIRDRGVLAIADLEQKR
jgi:replicative DNA helicase